MTRPSLPYLELVEPELLFQIIEALLTSARPSQRELVRILYHSEAEGVRPLQPLWRQRIPLTVGFNPVDQVERRLVSSVVGVVKLQGESAAVVDQLAAVQVNGRSGTEATGQREAWVVVLRHVVEVIHGPVGIRV